MTATLKLAGRDMAKGLCFPEGPIAMGDGSVLLVEIERGTLSRVDAKGKVEVVAETGGGPNGAAIGPDGKCYICNNGGFNWHHESGGYMRPNGKADNYSGGRIERVDLSTGKVEVLYTECQGEPLKGPNDIVFDGKRGFWFTDLGKVYGRQMDRGALYYARTDGQGCFSSSPSPVILNDHRRLASVSAKYSVLPSGESPIPFGVMMGNAASLMRLPSVRA